MADCRDDQLVALTQRALSAAWAEVLIAQHANAARDEMTLLADKSKVMSLGIGLVLLRCRHHSQFQDPNCREKGQRQKEAVGMAFESKAHPDGYDVVLHCLTDPSLLVWEAHRLADQAEKQLYAQVPGIGQVLIHVGPEGETGRG